MDYQGNGITIFNNEEFLLLLAASGMERWYGMEMPDQKNADKDERSLNATLASLYQKGIVDWKDGRARIRDAYRPMFVTLRDAAVCVLIKSGRTDDRLRACYCAGGRVVSVERRTASASEIEASVQTREEWLREVRTSGYLPATAGVPDEGPVPSPDPEPFTAFELRSVPDGKLLQTMNIYDQGLYACMETSDGNAAARDYYSPEKAVRILKEWSGGIA